MNLATKIELCKQLINNWKARNLTYFGKVTVIKSIILSKLTYLLQSVSVKKEQLTELNTILYNFLWSGKSEKIKRSTLIGSKWDSGINMVDVLSFAKNLKLKWIKSLKMMLRENGKLFHIFILNNSERIYLYLI